MRRLLVVLLIMLQVLFALCCLCSFLVQGVFDMAVCRPAVCRSALHSVGYFWGGRYGWFRAVWRARLRFFATINKPLVSLSKR